MSTDNITLNCLVYGDTPPPDRVFSVTIPKDTSIAALKKLIKGEKQNNFRGVDADRLVLWKVDIPLYMPNDMLAVLQANTNSDIAEVLHGEKLPVLFEVGECFTLALNKRNIHVIIGYAENIVSSPRQTPADAPRESETSFSRAQNSTIKATQTLSIWYRVELPDRYATKLVNFRGIDIDDFRKAIKATIPNDINCDHHRLVLHITHPDNLEHDDVLDDDLLTRYGNFDALVEHYQNQRTNPIKVVLPVSSRRFAKLKAPSSQQKIPEPKYIEGQSTEEVDSEDVPTSPSSAGSDVEEGPSVVNTPAPAANARKSLDMILTEVERLWTSWSPAFNKVITDGFPMDTFMIADHPRSKYINDAQIPTAKEGIALILHSLPETPGGPGYVDQTTLDSLVKMTEDNEWFMMIGTSGAGKTRSLYELFCQIYGVYLTFETGPNDKNIGSGDLDMATDNLPSKRNNPQQNSEKALKRIRAVLASRLFVLEKLLSGPNRPMPKTWLLMQLLPGRVMAKPIDFWITLSKELFGKSPGADLRCYIVNTVQNILKHVGQKRLPITFDEAQVAITMYAQVFYSKPSSHEKRSLFAILLRTVLEISEQGALCIVLSGTGLRIDDVKRDSASATATHGGVKSTHFYVVNNGFNNVTDMGRFLERFIGTLTVDQIAHVFKYLKGRRRFTILFLECVIENAKLPIGLNLDGMIRHWRSGAVEVIIRQMALYLTNIYQVRHVWPTVEAAMMNHHIFSEEKTIENNAAALAVEIGFAQLKRIDPDPVDMVTMIAGFSEPLAVMGFIRYHENKIGDKIGNMILERLGRYAWSPPTSGYLFERYLIAPLSNLFDNRGTTKYLLADHGLFVDHVSDSEILTRLLSNKISIRGGGMDHIRPETLCGKGHLFTYLDDPQYSFFMPENHAGPDVVFMINVTMESDTQQPEPITIPVFVQAKLRPDFSIETAIRTVKPKTFYNNKGQPDWCMERRKKTLECLRVKYRAAKDFGVSFIGILVMHPHKNTGRSCYDEDGGIILVIDKTNAKFFFDKEALGMFNGVKSSSDKKRLGLKKESSNIKRILRSSTF